MGTKAAVFAPLARNARQMIYNSPFCHELASGGLTPGDAEYVSIYSDFDNYVFPQESSNLGEKAKNIKVSYHGHVYLLYSPQVLKIVLQELEK